MRTASVSAIRRFPVAKLFQTNQEDALPTPSAQIIRTRSFSHKTGTYDVAAFVDPADPYIFRVDVTANGQPVVITYPDGLQATLGYSVTLMNRIDMSMTKGIDAISYLMQTAEDDIKRLL